LDKVNFLGPFLIKKYFHNGDVLKSSWFTEKLKNLPPHYPTMPPSPTTLKPPSPTNPEYPPELKATLCGLELKNPFIAASGILGGKASTIRRLEKLGAGAVVTKTITAEERLGYQGPTVVELDDTILLNAMGLPNPGARKFKKELEGLQLTIPLIISVAGKTPGDFAATAKQLAAHADALELNVSCPHPEPRGKRKILIGQDEEMVKDVVAMVTNEFPEKPVHVKLSPMVADMRGIVRACLEAGADGVSLINTVPALDIDLSFERPVLGNFIGGQSGRSVLCIAERKVAEAQAEISEWHKRTGRNVALIGCGGISSGLDAAKFLLIGADVVQVGTVLKNGMNAIRRMKNELKLFMAAKGYQRVDDFRGKAFRYLETIV